MTSKEIYDYVSALEEALRRADRQICRLIDAALKDVEAAVAIAAALLPDLGRLCPRCLGSTGLDECETCRGYGYTCSVEERNGKAAGRSCKAGHSEAHDQGGTAASGT